MANVADGATGTVLTAPSPATSGTSITLNPGEGYRFPAVPFFAVTHANNTIPTVSTSEKVQVTAQGQTTIAAGSNGAALPQGTVNVVDATSLNASGSVTIITSNGAQVVAYTGKTGTTLTGCTGGTGTMSTGGAVVGDNFTIVRGISPYSAQTVIATWRFSNAIFASDLNNASIVRNEVPVGAVNGSNATFTTASQFQTNSLEVYKNGIRMKGGGADYTATAGGFTMVTAPATGTVLLVDYFIGGTINNIGTNSLITDEAPSGSINGSNTVFTAARPYIGGGLEVYLNGIKQIRGVDFTETTPATGTFTLALAPLTGDLMRINYQYNLNPASNSDTVDGFHANATATANQLLPLNSNSKFPFAQLATMRLDVAETTDIHNGTSISAGTWIDVYANRNFTVGSANSLIIIDIIGTALIGNSGVAQTGSRAVIDSAATPVTRTIGGMIVVNGNYANPFAGSGLILISGLSAGTHTIKLQVSAEIAGNLFYLRASSVQYESLRTTILELGG